MPRGFLTLLDVRTPTLMMVGEPCGRRGRYNVQRLIEKHGADSAKLAEAPGVSQAEAMSNVGGR